MSIRLNKVTRDLNVGITTVVEFLQKQGFQVEANPNTKITDEQYAALVKEFSKDKKQKIESNKISQERMNKGHNTSVSIAGYNGEGTAKSPSDLRQKYTPLGKIDLDSINRKKPRTAEDYGYGSEQRGGRSRQSSAQKQNPQRQGSSQKITASAQPAVQKPEERSAKPAATVTEKSKPVETIVAESAPEVSMPTGNTSAEATSVASKPAESAAVVSAAAASNPVESEPVVSKSAASEPAENKAPASTAADSKPTATETPVTEEKVETAAETASEQPGNSVFKLPSSDNKSGITVVGKIDLGSLNQSTRPPKKSKEEKRKEREEQDKQRIERRKQMKDAMIKELRPAQQPASATPASAAVTADGATKKKKRTRINKEKVDLTEVTQTINNNSPQRQDKQRQKGQTASQEATSKHQKDRNKRPATKQDVSDEDVSKQVKETLARLTTKTKSKASKYRKEKRETIQTRKEEEKEMEQEESKILKLTEFVTANELANMMDVPVTQVISTCMSVGIMVSINQRLDAETINLVAEEFGFKTEYVSADVAQAVEEEEDAEEDLEPRAPIVTVMGHVDHGKTSLLDYIRKSNVIAGEAGGITQHIGAYNVKLEDGHSITFLDTPGHEAFTAMRARGAKVTDVAIIIVAADDNVMPQTKEAINHAMAAGVPIVFAINKIDKPGANPEKIKEELANMNFLVEEWGGKYQSQDISAKKGIAVNELLEKVLLEAELLELKANPNRRATGSVIESSLDKGRGYVATLLISNGTLHVGDIVLAGTSYGKVKAMFNERNQRIKQAGPSEPVQILGLNGAPAAGDSFHVFEMEQEAREIANRREQLQREQGLRTQKMLTLDEVGRRLALGDFHELNVIVKGDVDGSVEALSDSLIKLSTDKIQVNVIHRGVGQISESDVSLASASDAIIVGFQVRPSTQAAKLAEQEGVDIRKYSVIYDAIEEVKAAMEGMLAPTVKEQVTATLEVLEVFNISKVGMVAGATVKTGKVKRTDKARVIRDGIVVFTGTINALKRFKDDVKEVATNFECGISLNNCNDLKVNDVIETYEEVEVKQKL